MKPTLTRRTFMAAGAAAAACTAARPAPEGPILRAGLVGCGGRGTGAAENFLLSAPDLELIALGDAFEHRLKSSKDQLEGLGHPGVKIAHTFTGLDAYKQVIDCGVDVVLLATPPGFRPLHLEAAIEAGKHAFIEKPCGVDPVGVRKVIALGEKARGKKLGILAGTQYRHQASFIATIKEIHAGRIGKVLGGRAYYNTGLSWSVPRKKGWSDFEWQMRNWLYFDWLSGDHIIEQHVHTIDVTNWVMGGPPVSAVAVGGRAARTEPRYGNVYDHFCVDYEYPQGVHVLSMCRQMGQAATHLGAYFTGSEGTASPYLGMIEGANPWKYGGTDTIAQAYVQEHRDFVESIRRGEPLNEARQVAESTLTGIMGREAAYTGQHLKWDEFGKSELDLSPPKHDMAMELPVRPSPKPGQPR